VRLRCVKPLILQDMTCYITYVITVHISPVTDAVVEVAGRLSGMPHAKLNI
jgi:hypothetical protein